MDNQNWEDLTKGKKFISDIGANIVKNDVSGNIVNVGRYAVWYPIPNHMKNSLNQTHQIVEVGEDLDYLCKKHLITDLFVFKLPNSLE